MVFLRITSLAVPDRLRAGTYGRLKPYKDRAYKRRLSSIASFKISNMALKITFHLLRKQSGHSK